MKKDIHAEMINMGLTILAVLITKEFMKLDRNSDLEIEKVEITVQLPKLIMTTIKRVMGGKEFNGTVEAYFTKIIAAGQKAVVEEYQIDQDIRKLKTALEKTKTKLDGTKEDFPTVGNA